MLSSVDSHMGSINLSSPLAIVLVILGLGLLMVIHESGHYFAARFFGMRVTKFSIGMPPVLFRLQPKDSPTTFQIGAIPFMAYVQIAGMNPLEEQDKKDKGSYANASLLGRIVTIFAGSFANYLVASLLFFVSLMVTGERIPTTRIEPMPDTPAAKAGFLAGDKVVEVEGVAVKEWDEFRKAVSARPDQLTHVVVERNGERLTLEVTPKKEGDQGRIGARYIEDTRPMEVKKALKASAMLPPMVVTELVRGVIRMVKDRKLELGGPVAIAKEGARAVNRGMGDYLWFLAIISANLAGFNLLPFPALDGGRLLFLGYEAVSRRRPDAMVEAQVHVVGLFMLLALMVFVTFGDVMGRH